MRDLIVSALFGEMNELLEESNSTLSTQTVIIPKVLLQTLGKIKTSVCIRNILGDSLQPLIGLFLISQLKVF